MSLRLFFLTIKNSNKKEKRKTKDANTDLTLNLSFTFNKELGFNIPKNHGLLKKKKKEAQRYLSRRVPRQSEGKTIKPQKLRREF